MKLLTAIFSLIMAGTSAANEEKIEKSLEEMEKIEKTSRDTAMDCGNDIPINDG